MRYIVTELGPIDRHAPGTDVTGIYGADVLSRLIDEGYVTEWAEADEAHTVWDDEDDSGVIVADIDEDEDGD